MTPPSAMPGPVVRLWPEADRYHDQLMDMISSLRTAASSTLNVGGTWCSSKRVCDEPAAAPLVAWIRTLVPRPVEMVGWGLILTKGDQGVSAHRHNRSATGGINTWAAVYYLDVPDSRSGWFRAGDWAFIPQVGAALVFPADCEHSVDRYTGEGDRVTLGFNLKEAPCA